MSPAHVPATVTPKKETRRANSLVGIYFNTGSFGKR
jgi:hypothetical protein